MTSMTHARRAVGSALILLIVVTGPAIVATASTGDRVGPADSSERIGLDHPGTAQLPGGPGRGECSRPARSPRRGMAPAPVSRTGQTACSDADGASIDCAGTGQDGEVQAGVTVAPRFTDRGDGTVSDNLTGLIWLRDAGCAGGLGTTFDAALAVAGALASGECGLGDGSVAGDWRMPNIKEMLSLIDFGMTSPALPADHPFTGLDFGIYWTSTPWELWPEDRYFVAIADGWFDYGARDNLGGAWPVRGEASRRACGAAAGSAHAPVPATGKSECWGPGDQGQIDCAGTGQDGETQTGVAVERRFIDRGDGTARDALTGLTWLRNGLCFGQRSWDAALREISHLRTGACGLTDGSAPGDWRLPNVKEMESLIDYGQIQPSLPPDHPFAGFLAYDYWTSTTVERNPERAFRVNLWAGYNTIEVKRAVSAVWPVRGHPAN